MYETTSTKQQQQRAHRDPVPFIRMPLAASDPLMQPRQRRVLCQSAYGKTVPVTDASRDATRTTLANVRALFRDTYASSQFLLASSNAEAGASASDDTNTAIALHLDMLAAGLSIFLGTLDVACENVPITAENPEPPATDLAVRAVHTRLRSDPNGPYVAVTNYEAQRTVADRAYVVRLEEATAAATAEGAANLAEMRAAWRRRQLLDCRVPLLNALQGLVDALGAPNLAVTRLAARDGATQARPESPTVQEITDSKNRAAVADASERSLRAMLMSPTSRAARATTHDLAMRPVRRTPPPPLRLSAPASLASTATSSAFSLAAISARGSPTPAAPCVPLSAHLLQQSPVSE